MKKLVLILVTLVATISLTGCMNVLDSGSKQGANAAFIYCGSTNYLEFIVDVEDSSEMIAYDITHMNVVSRSTEFEDLNEAVEARIQFFEDNGRICQRVTL
jgi:hypothetical protein